MLAESENTIASTCAGVIFETITNGTSKLKLMQNCLSELEPKNNHTISLIPIMRFQRITKAKSDKLPSICIKIIAVINFRGSVYWRKVL